MPFDGNESEFDAPVIVPADDLSQAIWFLERALRRVKAGYCAMAFYRCPKPWHWSPRYCMVGAMEYTDSSNEWEPYDSKTYHGKRIARKYVEAAVGNYNLVAFGSIPLISRRRVIRAFNRALASAKHEMNFR